MATTVLGLKTFAASDPVDYNEVNDNYVKIDNGVKTAMQGRAAHNLLDNSDFTNPVNQRGVSAWNSGIGIDRWYASNEACSKQNGYVRLASGANMYQIIPNEAIKLGKPYTIALCFSGNTIICNSGVLPTTTPEGAPELIWATDGNMRVSLRYESIGYYLSIRNFASGGYGIQWAALYEGAYDASTLPAYVPKGYAAELAECQRYYQTRDTSNYQVIILGDELYFAIEHLGMRIAPSITIINPIANENNSIANLASGGKFATEIRTITKDRSIIYVATGTSGKSYAVSYTASADL